MISEELTPNLELLRQEYVLVQAWKKTASYIRYHNWYSDTLELDRITVNLPDFIAELSDSLAEPELWENDLLRIVPAPKSQRWGLTSEKTWLPKKGTKVPLRPLAHVSIKDQVVATAVMLCLANRVETIQGDPRLTIGDSSNRNKVVSYGNRLFCGSDYEAADHLQHRWGSTKLYRSYYQDYQAFILRPECVAESVDHARDTRTVIVHSDLRQFYDRVRPALLAEKMATILQPDDDPAFWGLVQKLLNWKWHRKDEKEIFSYSNESNIPGFSNVALPQGLVSAGFFSNISLLGFDNDLREAFGSEVFQGITLIDSCRYVDDLRLVLRVPKNMVLDEVEQVMTKWLQSRLENTSPGLQIAKEKTKAIAFRGDERPLIRQSRKMRRIQGAVSGGFDMQGGLNILDSIQGLIRSQSRFSEERTNDQGWELLPVPDVGDSTVARFAAGRYRKTYRSIRPLLRDDSCYTAYDLTSENEDVGCCSGGPQNQEELDDEAKAFSLGLIENWIEDPSNVRLLRIGLDIWPEASVLKRVLELLRPFTEKNGPRKEPRRVAWYCLAEIFRAGATETGFVEEGESLSSRIDLEDYRSILRDEASRIISSETGRMPWYLEQQALLFIASCNDGKPSLGLKVGKDETAHYYSLIRYLRGQETTMRRLNIPTCAVLARRSYWSREKAVSLVGKTLTSSRLDRIAEKDPSFALELIESTIGIGDEVSPRVRDDLCLSSGPSRGETLATIVAQEREGGRLRNELGILSFAATFLKAYTAESPQEVITPNDVELDIVDIGAGIGEATEITIRYSKATPLGSIYAPPKWCPPNKWWRFSLGYLLRYILASRPDFTRSVRKAHWKERENAYRVPENHWYQRRYGLFNGQTAFGDDWLPITDWTEELLLALLYWPGCRKAPCFEMVRDIETALEAIEGRLKKLKEKFGHNSNTLFLPFKTNRPTQDNSERPLRACIVQSVVPGPDAFATADLALNNPSIRRQHRNHLSTALAAVERMLDLRETHISRNGRLDWLILPELAVHPADVQTHLVPFARMHKTIILTGLTYERLIPGQPLVNSALWVIPSWSSAYGLQIITRRQGKKHLAPEEDSLLNKTGVNVIGWRPCQWLIGYDWNHSAIDPLWLTSSICYDATDLDLVADLRHQSDVFAVPALNKDVNTFDTMAQALHYHMFQYVILANNGLYGGSNAYAPYKKAYDRQVFHLHGQPQASIGFLEIDDIGAYLRRKKKHNYPRRTWGGRKGNIWKSKPAGLK